MEHVRALLAVKGVDDRRVVASEFEGACSERFKRVDREELCARGEHGKDGDVSLGRQRVKHFGGVLRRKVDIGDEMDDRLARRFLRRPARRHRDLVTVEQRLLAAGTGGGGGVHGADVCAAGVAADDSPATATQGLLAGDVDGAVRTAGTGHAVQGLVLRAHPMPPRRCRARGSAVRARR